MPDREQMSFSASDFGIVSTEEIAGETFLNSDPEDIQFIKPSTKEKVKEDDEETKEEDKDSKGKKKVKEIVAPSSQVSEDDVFSSMEKKIKNAEEPESEDEETTSETEEEEGEVNVYASVAKELFNNGIFTIDEDEEEDEISTPEDLLARFQYQSRKNLSETIEKFLGRYGDDYRDMFESVYIKGVKPEDYLSRYTKIQGVKALDISDEGNQERVVRELYRSEGRSSEYIEKKITQLKNYNDLHEEATEAQRILIQREEDAIQQDVQKRESEIARKTHIRNEYVNSMNRILSDKLKTKEFDGIPIDKKIAEQTFAYLTQERFQTPDKKLLTTFDKDFMDLDRPENHELKVKIAILLQMAKEDPKLTKLATKAVSKETNELFKGLKKTASKNSQTTKETTQEKEKVNSWFQN